MLRSIGEERGLQTTATTAAAAPFPYEFPTFRYQVWEAKDVTAQAEAGALQYDADSWNYETFNPIEDLSYATIQGGDVTVQSAVGTMGFTETVWDCFIK